MTKKRPPNQWQPGETGNPKGRPPGQSEITKLRKSIMSDEPEILARLVTAAKAVDVQAARLILERVLPPIKPNGNAGMGDPGLCATTGSTGPKAECCACSIERER